MIIYRDPHPRSDARLATAAHKIRDIRFVTDEVTLFAIAFCEDRGFQFGYHYGFENAITLAARKLTHDLEPMLL
jgi:hypothetical protein